MAATDTEAENRVLPSRQMRAVRGVQWRGPEVQTALLGPAAIAFPLAASLYNAVLAIANAAGLTQSFRTVTLTELLILGSLSVYLTFSHALDPIPIRLLVLGVLVSFYVTCASGSLSLDVARDVAIIALFFGLGARMSSVHVQLFFRILTSVVLVVLLLEIVRTDLYARIFAPAAYYSQTRGIQEFSLDNSGLFRNSLGFGGRFSFGLSSHRTASAFIEQVSLANYAAVLGIYLLSCFPTLRLPDRILCMGTVVLILLTNDSRTSTALILLSVAGYAVYPMLSRAWCLLIMPAVLAAGVLVYLVSRAVEAKSVGDNLSGRVTHTITSLGSFDAGALFGFDAALAPSFMDSGYAFVIVCSTVFGLVLFWLFAATVIDDRTPSMRRCLFGLNLYLCTNMMIGGTAIFSIKVAAPLWLLVGFMAAARPARLTMKSSVLRRGHTSARAMLASGA